MKIFDIGKRFIFIIPLNIEICWWKSNNMGVYIYPAIVVQKSGNTKGFKIRFLKYTIDFSYYFR